MLCREATLHRVAAGTCQGLRWEGNGIVATMDSCFGAAYSWTLHCGKYHAAECTLLLAKMPPAAGSLHT